MHAARGAVRASPTEACVAAVVIATGEPLQLARCLAALMAQRRPPDDIVVVDDAIPGKATSTLAAFPEVCHVRHLAPRGAAASACTGIETAILREADLVWLMRDDGWPADEDCLGRLIDGLGGQVGVMAPLVTGRVEPQRLACPELFVGRSRFLRQDAVAILQPGQAARLLLGALVHVEVFHEVGLPDPRFLCCGEEADFLLRVCHADIPVRLDLTASFLHAGAWLQALERRPILFGRSHALLPASEHRQHCLFRNRAFLARRYRMDRVVLADAIRYGCLYLLRRRPDLRGFAAWLRLTREGRRADFMRRPLPSRASIVLRDARSAAA